MSDFDPKPVPSTFVTSYSEFEGIMAESFVRTQVRLAKLALDFDERFPLEIARSLLAMGDSLKNVVAFLADNADDIFDSLGWKVELEDFFFMEKTRRYKHRDLVEHLEEVANTFEPEALAHLLVNDFSYFVARVSIALSQIDDGYVDVAGTKPSEKAKQVVHELNVLVLGLQTYLAEPEIRPSTLAKIAPISVDGSDQDHDGQVNLISIAMSVAKAVERGDSLDEIARDMGYLAKVNLEDVLRKLYETVPDVAMHLNSLFFHSSRSQNNPWPFNAEVKEWIDSRLDPQRKLPESYYSKQGSYVDFAYLRQVDISFEEPHGADSIWRNPFDIAFEPECDDCGNESIEIAFVEPGIVPPNCPVNRMPKYQVDKSKLDVGLVRTILMN